MGDERDWQKQLMTAALMAAARTAVQYVTNPNGREEAMHDVKSRLAEVDYGAAGRAVSEIIDRVAESAKSALNEAIDSIRENAEEAVEAAAERAQEQLGSPRKRGKGRMLFGVLLGIALGFILLNEDRRNQLMDKVTGASGPIDASEWSTVAASQPESSPSPAPPPAPESPPPAAPKETEPVGSAETTAAETDNGSGGKAAKSKAKNGEAK